MNIVGYIIGLGDRHLSNLMIFRESGKLVHIDYGDCFEISRNREKLPEKVPFRLTDLFLNVLGSRANYDLFVNVCEQTLKTLK